MAKKGVKWSAKTQSAMRSSMKKLSTVEVKQVHRIVKKDMRKAEETKHTDTRNLLNPIATIPSNINLMIPAQGLGDQARIGDKIRISSIRLRVELQNYGSSVASDNPGNVTWRIIIVQDKSYNVSTTGIYPAGSAQIAPDQLLIQDAFNQYGVTSQRNVDHLVTYTVLYDRCFTTQYNNNSNRVFNIKVPMKYVKRNVQFSNANNITALTNGIFMYVVTDKATFPQNPSMIYSSRILYTDS